MNTVMPTKLLNNKIGGLQIVHFCVPVTGTPVTVLNILCHMFVYKNVMDVLGRIYTHDFILHTVYRSVRI